jgi:hypothetical protein
MGRAAMNNDGHGPRAHGVPMLSDPPDRGATQDFLGPDRSKCLEVGLSSDEREVLINIPDVGEQWLTFSPEQARHLAKLLLRKADECKP